MFEKIPNWLGTVVVGAVFAVLGYAGKAFIVWRTHRRAEHAATLGRLQALAALLKTSDTLFLVQNEQAHRLMDLLEERNPGQTKVGQGFEEVFARSYDSFPPDAKALHGIIRAITQHSLRPVNQAMSDWLKADTEFKTAAIATGQQEMLADYLQRLEVHLMLWHAKYEYWIPNDPKHALVYLDDEKKHGVGFPKGIETLVNAALAELRRRGSLRSSAPFAEAPQDKPAPLVEGAEPVEKQPASPAQTQQT